jgi:hypothetical protein
VAHRGDRPGVTEGVAAVVLGRWLRWNEIDRRACGHGGGRQLRRCGGRLGIGFLRPGPTELLTQGVVAVAHRGPPLEQS